MILFQHRLAVTIFGILIVMLDQQPVGAFAAESVAPHAHQHPAAFQLFPRQHEFEIAFGQHFFGVAIRLPEAAIPQHHRAAAILAFGNGPFKIAVIERMVFHLHRQPLVGGIERGPPCHRPGTEGAVQLQPEIIMQPRGGMFLDHKAQRRGLFHPFGAAGFGGLGEIPHGTVFCQPCWGFLFGGFFRGFFGFGHGAS